MDRPAKWSMPQKEDLGYKNAKIKKNHHLNKRSLKLQSRPVEKRDLYCGELQSELQFRLFFTDFVKILY